MLTLIKNVNASYDDKIGISNLTTVSKLPLSGIRVLDLSTFIAGPYTAGILGEFGADVIKVEKPGDGDPMRQFGTPTERKDSSLAWLSEGRNKKSVTLDLKQTKGQTLFRDLVGKSDVICENFRPGTLENWGLGPADFKDKTDRGTPSCHHRYGRHQSRW